MNTITSPEFLDLQAAVAGRYSIERELGRGGMGVVFLAQDVALERPVAIKLLPRHLANDATLRERFLREARTAAQLMHPNIVPIHAVEASDGLVFFVMAFVDGETLAECVARTGPLSPDGALRVMREVAWALSYAHGRGVVHRDIKPDNILVEHASGRAMVADFGIARVASRETLSVDGSFVGTVQYMSPEQASAEELDGRSDIYSLAATIYFALTGASPVEAPTLAAMLSRLLTEEPAALATVRPETPTALAEIVSRALAKNRAARFDSADALVAALQQAGSVTTAVRPEVRAFLRELTTGKALLIAGLGGMLGGAVSYGAGMLRAGTASAIAILGVGALAMLVVAVTGDVLQLRRDRIPWEDVDAGIAAELIDLAAMRRRQIKDHKDLRRVYGVLGVFLLAISALALFVWWRVPDRIATEVAPAAWLLVASAFYAFAGLTFVLVARSRKPLPWWFGSKLGSSTWSADALLPRLVRSVMRWTPLARLYSLKFGYAPKRSSAPALPTATLLLQRVEELVAKLPAHVRARLGDVLPVAAGLERAIAALRARLDQLDRAKAELPAASPAQADFTVARERTAVRLVECVGALERVRADLLRLSAGLIAADGITSELEKAQELSAAIDAELHGLDAVRQFDA